MISHLLIVGLEGLTLTDFEKDFLEKYQPAGVILFSRNYESPAQLVELIASIQELAHDKSFFISVDQEGGRVQRFKKQFTLIPAAMEIAKKNSPKLVFDYYHHMGQELKACGVNMDFAPVCDALTNAHNTVIGDRAFSTDLNENEKYISAAVRGLITSGIISCAKHLPGHGRSKKDSHTEKVILKITQEELNQEMQSFKRAAKSKVPTMMVSHMIVDILDNELPCSLSPKAMSYFKEELNFKGLFISDDMDMAAINDFFEPGEALRLAAQAGCHLIIYRTIQSAEKALDSFESSDMAIDPAFLKNQMREINDLKSIWLKDYKVPKVADMQGVLPMELKFS